MGRAVVAVVRKDLADSRRNPLFLTLSVLVPLVFIGIFALIIQTSATNPLAVAVQHQGKQSSGFLEVLRTIGSKDGSYFRITTTDPEEARRQYEQGEVPAILHIPRGFDERLETGETAQVVLELFNIDSDVAKNLELRVSHAVVAYGGDFSVDVSETSAFPSDIPMQRYFGTALVMFAVIYLGMMSAGTLVAGEWEQGTAKATVLSPLGFGPLIAGKWLAAAGLTGGGLALVLVVVVLALDYPAWRLAGESWMYLSVIFTFAASLGTLLGVKFKNSLLLVPASAVVSVANLLLAGFESYLRGFAHDGVLALLWRIGSWWPVSALTDSIRFQIEGFDPVDGRGGLIGMVLVTAVLGAAAVRHLRRHLQFAQGM